MALEDLEKEAAAEVRWGCEVVGIREEGEGKGGKAVVKVRTEEGVEELEADYVVGCDGANSTIRRQLFGDEFPGYTWDLQIIATNVSRSPPFLPLERLNSQKDREREERERGTSTEKIRKMLTREQRSTTTLKNTAG